MSSLVAGTYSVPAKTFLVGEYVALDGGPSILLTTNPQFHLRVVRSPRGHERSPFNPASPAGKYAERYAVDFEGYDLVFDDPHRGKGGLGASSAQYALAYAAHHGLKSIDGNTFEWRTLIDEYTKLAWSGIGTPPSGADVVAQLVGGVTFYDGRGSVAGRLPWNFKTIAFTLFRTGSKLATHEHLKEGKRAPVDGLRTLVYAARAACESGDGMKLAEAIEATSIVLKEAGLVAERTQALLAGMRKKKELFLAAKGCGAMGSDVILALHEKTRTNDVMLWGRQENLEVCGTDADLSEGFKVQP